MCETLWASEPSDTFPPSFVALRLPQRSTSRSTRPTLISLSNSLKSTLFIPSARVLTGIRASVLESFVSSPSLDLLSLWNRFGVTDHQTRRQKETKPISPDTPRILAEFIEETAKSLDIFSRVSSSPSHAFSFAGPTLTPVIHSSFHSSKKVFQRSSCEEFVRLRNNSKWKSNSQTKTQFVHQSVHQSINPSIHQSINPSIHQSVHHTKSNPKTDNSSIHSKRES